MLIALAILILFCLVLGAGLLVVAKYTPDVIDGESYPQYGDFHNLD